MLSFVNVGKIKLTIWQMTLYIGMLIFKRSFENQNQDFLNLQAES